MRHLAGVALGVLLHPVAVQAQVTPLFTMDMTQCDAGHPLCGSSELTESSGGEFTKSYQATGGPGASIPSVQYVFNIVGGGQNNLGMRWNGIAVPAQGSLRVIRFWFKIHAGFNAPSSHWGNKIMIFGAGANDSQRMMIIGQTFLTNSDWAMKCSVNINGTPDAAEGIVVSIGGWHAFQCAMQSSSTAVATDGSIKAYLDNDVAGSPTATSGAMTQPITTAQWDDLQIGGFSDNIGAGDTLTFSFTCVEFDDAFDPNWYSAGVPTTRCGGGGQPVGGPYYRVRRLFGEASWVGLPVGILRRKERDIAS